MEKRYCIFDMDGTLVDSMPYWQSLGREFIAGKGWSGDAEALLERTKPLPMEESARIFIEALGLRMTPEEVSAEILRQMERHYREDIPAKAGVREALAALAARGVRMGIATATPEYMVRLCLERLGLAERMEFVVSCESVCAGKDRPDVFLAAARRFGADRLPREIAVFEDTLQALRTAKDAGFYTVAVSDASGADTWAAAAALADEAVPGWPDWRP